jgi:type I restriction enzyme S subunit
MLLLQYFDELTLQPQNAKKLKGLILELAVRGKLTKKWRIENPNTESATKLLTEIKAEKKRLIAEKKIKKESPLPKIEAEEIPFELPESWVWCRLGNIVTLKSGTTFKKEYELNEGDYEYIKVSGMNLLGNEYEITTSDIYINSTPKIDKALIPKRSIIFPKRGGAIATNKKRIVSHPILVDTNTMAMVCPNSMDFKYLFTWFNSIDLWKLNNGTSVPQINNKDILPLYFPLPPLSEQKAIVKIVEQLFEEVEVLERLTEERLVIKQNYITAILNRLANENTEATWQQLLPQFEQFFDTEKSIKALRQTILQLAVQGKLTKDWRKANPNTASATELLQQIKTEKKRLITEKVIKKEKVLPKITKEEIPFELPENWVWCRLGNIAQFINGDRGKNYPNKSEYVEKGIPWINTGHIKPNGTLSTTKMNYITKEKFDILRGGKIKDGDLVYCLRGATFGKTAFVTPYNIGAIASSLMIIRLYFLDLGQFTYRFLISNEGRKQLLRFDNGSAQPNLSANKVKLYLYPLPPLSEQKAIVEKVATLLGYCDALEAAIAERGKRVEALMDGSLSGILGV